VKPGIGVRQGRDPRQARCGDQAILQRVPQALDPSFGLRAQGVDGLDPERRHRTADLRRVLGALELFRERPARVVAPEDAMAVHVEGEGNPTGGHERPEQPKVAPGILRRHELRAGQEGAGGIVHRGDQAAARPPRLQPGMRAAVPEHELAGLRLAEPARAVPRGAATARPGHARRAQEPMHGGPAHGEAVLGLELLGQMRGVQTGVSTPV
jgi:hypothetical protein